MNVNSHFSVSRAIILHATHWVTSHERPLMLKANLEHSMVLVNFSSPNLWLNEAYMYISYI